MNSIRFEAQSLVVAVDPNRADIACFVGFVARREGTALPSFIRGWMNEYGWTEAQLGWPGFDPEALEDVPIPIDSWELFHRLFRWDQRTTKMRGITYLGAAVRSFFSQGGRKCYVVRVGDPWGYGLPRAARLARVDDLIPGWATGQLKCTPLDRLSWKGHLFGLPDVSYLCLPDLPEVFAVDAEPVASSELPRLLEQFVECGTEPAESAARDPVR